MSPNYCPFDILPVELFASILSELDIASLISASAVSSLFRSVVVSPLLNPWRQPIRRLLASAEPYDPAFSTLGARLIVPRHNWIEILSLAKLEWLLFEAVLPNLREEEWAEAFKRRWLPSMQKRAKDARWKQVFIKTLMRISHRLGTSCTADESWCKYVILNRNGSANVCEGYSRTFSPLAVFDELKLQNNMMHLDTQTRLLVQFQDIRVIVLGVLHHSNSLFVNSNARQLLHPPGVNAWEEESESSSLIGTPRGAETHSSSDDSMNRAWPLAAPRAPAIGTSSTGPQFTPTAAPLRCVSLTRTLSSDSTGRGRPFLRARLHDSDSPSSPSGGVLRRLTISFGDRWLHAMNADAGPSNLRVVENVHAPIGQFGMASPDIGGNDGSDGSDITEGSSNFERSITPQASSATIASYSPASRTRMLNELPFARLRHPTPITAHGDYPNYTTGGADNRWRGNGISMEIEEEGRVWAGPMMVIGQLVSQGDVPTGEEVDIAGQSRWASFTAEDLFAVAPWMEERVTKTIEGMGLGN